MVKGSTVAMRRHRAVWRGPMLAAAALTATTAMQQGASASIVTSTSGSFTPTGPVVSPFPAGLSFTPASNGISPALVTPSSNFSSAVVGYNNSTGNGIFLTATITAPFGVTGTVASGGLGGQTVTVSSNESIGATTTTDTVTISVPTGFDPSGTTFNGSSVNNQTVNEEFFQIGEYNGGSTPISLLLPINPATQTSSGSALYSGGTLALTATTTLGATDTTIAENEGVSAGTSDLSTFAVRQFTYAITYATTPVPEPTTGAALLVGGAGVLIRRRHKRQA